MTYTAAYRVDLIGQYGNPITTIDTVNGKPLDADGAHALADILRAGSGKHEVLVTQAPPTVMQVWRILLDLADEHGLPAPNEISVGRINVEISLPMQERGQADAWADALGLPRGVLSSTAHTHVRYRTPETDRCPVLPGWSVQVYTVVSLGSTAAREHGDGLAAPDPDEYAAWKAARDAELAVAAQRRVRDRDGHVWEERPDGDLVGVSRAVKGTVASRELLEAGYGPLSEITDEQPARVSA